MPRISSFYHDVLSDYKISNYAPPPLGEKWNPTGAIPFPDLTDQALNSTWRGCQSDNTFSLVFSTSHHLGKENLYSRESARASGQSVWLDTQVHPQLCLQLFWHILICDDPTTFLHPFCSAPSVLSMFLSFSSNSELKSLQAEPENISLC